MHKIFQKIIIFLFYFFAFVAFIALSVFFIFIFYKGVNAFSIKLIFDDTPPLDALMLQARVFNGIFNAIVGSFFVVFVSIILALPLGFLSGIYVACYASKNVRFWMGFLCELLSSMPSIVIGLFGLSVTIFLHKNFFAELYPSLLISACSLAILVIPYIIKMTESSLCQIPFSIKNVGLNLGASKTQNLFFVQLPYVSKEILGGIILATGRAVEDTAVIMMTGAVAMAGIPSSIFQKYEALPFFIYHISSEYSSKEQINQGFGAAILLLGVSLFLFATAFALRKIISKRSGFGI